MSTGHICITGIIDDLAIITAKMTAVSGKRLVGNLKDYVPEAVLKGIPRNLRKTCSLNCNVSVPISWF